jgi:tRNA-(ms[2]io[6]A)-hydroxylase
MLGLKIPTDIRWAQLAETDLQALLSDHAWCEQKAATNALGTIVRYPQETELVEALTAIAQEELAHFGQVLEKMRARGLALKHEQKDDYVGTLAQFIRKGGSRKQQLVDRLLFSAMIEARSCERFKMLSEKLSDPDLKQFYWDLMVSEAHHYKSFIELARTHGGDEIDVDGRWRDFLAYEAEVIQRFGHSATIHG